MKTADWLIVAGVVVIPFAVFVAYAIDAVLLYIHPVELDNWTEPAGASLAGLVVAVAAGLITAGILMRKRSPSN